MKGLPSLFGNCCLMSLNTQGERYMGKTNMAVYNVFDGMIHKVSILFMDESPV